MGRALCSSASPKIYGIEVSQSGFRFDGATVFSILNLQYDDDRYSKGLAKGIRDFILV
jgi:arsenite methyltransferase